MTSTIELLNHDLLMQGKGDLQVVVSASGSGAFELWDTVTGDCLNVFDDEDEAFYVVQKGLYG